MKQNAHKIFVNTLMLTAAALVMRGVGMIFQVYLADKIGASSLGLYSLIMSVYTMFVTLGSGGIRFAVSRLTAECSALKGNIRKTVLTSLIYALVLGVFSAWLLFFGAGFIADRWIGMIEAVLALKILALSLPFISVSSVFGGYFTGVERVVRSVCVNIFEQLGRIALTVILLGRYGSLGITYICAALAASAMLGECISCALHIILYIFDVRRFPKSTAGERYWYKIFSTAMPIAVSAYMRTGLSSLGHILIPKGLRKSGANFAAAFETYGYIHAMTFPVLLFPSALLSALAELIVPRLTAAQAEGRKNSIDYMSGRVFKSGLIFSVGIGVIMFFFGKELGMAIYKTSQVGYFMHIFAPLVPIMYCDMITDGCLKGLGLHMKAMYINLAEATLNVVLLYFLIPRLGIMGYGISIYVCECFNFFFSFKTLLSCAKIQISPIEIFSIFISGIIAAFLSKMLFSGIAASIIAVIGIYAALLIIFEAIPYSDVRWMKNIIHGNN